MIIANKMDLVESGQKKRAVSEKEIIDFCVEQNLSFKETSAKTGYNVRETFNEFAQSMHQGKQTSTIGETNMVNSPIAARSTMATQSLLRRKNRVQIIMIRPASVAYLDDFAILFNRRSVQFI